MTASLDLTRKIPLGSTGIETSRLGIGSSYGVSRKACLEAFDSGVNYFFWGSTRTPGMALAIRELAPTHRDELCVVLQVYARRPSLVARSVKRGLDALRLDSVDILLLGWHEKAPALKTLEAAESERRKGTFKHLAISSHQRPLFRDLLKGNRYGAYHLRYNAAHTGAEEDVFPFLPEDGPGIVAFTCLRWGDLLNPKKMPPGESPLTAAECYRFALSDPHVHIAISGPKNDQEMRHAIGALEAGPLDAEEMKRVRRIGAYLHEQKSVADWFR